MSLRTQFLLTGFACGGSDFDAPPNDAPVGALSAGKLTIRPACDA